MLKIRNGKKQCDQREEQRGRAVQDEAEAGRGQFTWALYILISMQVFVPLAKRKLSMIVKQSGLLI